MGENIILKLQLNSFNHIGVRVSKLGIFSIKQSQLVNPVKSYTSFTSRQV